jgi:ribosome-associated toxin RatA of RatAB toxin-antitoxin module
MSLLNRLSLLIVPVLFIGLIAGGIARAETTEEMGNFDGGVDKNQTLHMQISANMNAPVDRVFDALSHPELVAKYDPNVTGAKVVSQSGDSKIVELTGQAVPIPNAPKSLRVKITPNKADNTIEATSVDNPFITFDNKFKLVPSADGKGTVVNYTTTSSISKEASQAIGMDIPEGMRKQLALTNFMEQLHSVGEYIDKAGSGPGGGRVASN